MLGSSSGFTWSPFSKKSLLEQMMTPSPPRSSDFVLPLLLDDDDDPEETSTKRTMSEKDLPPSVKEKLERKRRK